MATTPCKPLGGACATLLRMTPRRLLVTPVLLAARPRHRGRIRRARAAPAREHGRPDVVLLVLDEFPGDSLLGEGGRIDPVRYPNFAALAGDATWFRNAYSVYDSTTKAVPLILDGQAAAAPERPADTRYHPRVDLHGAGAARLPDREPPRRPPRSARPASAAARAPAGRRSSRGSAAAARQRFDRFVRLLRPSRRPTLWMKHALLPHGPYLYLPSGARTRAAARDLVRGHERRARASTTTFLTRHNEQRYLLQLGFVDRLIGRLVRRLKAQGMYDDTLSWSTADHGISWRPGVTTRRQRRAPSNVEELTPVPLIVKRARPAPRARQRRLRAHARRDAHDRGPAEPAARISRGRPLGLRPRRAPAPHGEPHRRVTSGRRADLGPALGGAPRERSCGAGCASSARATTASTRGSGRTAS